jgi:tetratricopeptide (TPR) repeat protein
VTKQQGKQPSPFFSTIWGALTRKVRRSHNKERFDITLAIKGGIEVDIDILSPRNTRLLAAPKTFEWTEVPSAAEYLLTVGYFTGKNKIWQTKVNGTSFSLENVDIPIFALGKTYLWEMEAYNNNGRSITSDTAWFLILTEEERDAIRDSIRLIQQNAPDDKMTEHLLLATFYEENELYLESERELKEVIGENDQASLHLMLADLYLKLGLTRQSKQEFQKAGEIPAEMSW